MLRGYREHVTLEAEELDRLGAVARSRPLILRAWSVCMGQTTSTEAMTAASETKALTEMIATRIRAAVTPLISRWPPDVTLMARARHDYGVCSAP